MLIFLVLSIRWRHGEGHFRQDSKGDTPDHDGGVSGPLPRGMWMVMLDSVGIPSGVHVKKPPMIFIGSTPPPAREQKDSWIFSVEVSCLPSSLKAKPPLPH